MKQAEEVINGSDYQLKAVIDLGSTSIRMVVAQVYTNGAFQTLDTLSQSVAIGSDTFTRGRISRSIINDSVKVIRNFSAVLKEYGIDSEKDIRAVATSAVREARNRDEFVDRVYMATGMNIEVIEGTEVNRLTFLAIQPVLKENEVLRKGRLLVAEVGGGSTELLGLDHARVSFAHVYKMGSHRLRESMDEQTGSEARRQDVLRMEIEAGVRQCRDAVKQDKSKLSLLLMGGEARFAARTIASKPAASTLAHIKVSELSNLADRILSMDTDRIVRKYHMAVEEAQTLGPALLAYVMIAKAFEKKSVYICNASLRDGLLTEAASGGSWSEDFVEQILHSVREVGRRYNLDQAHADCITHLSLELFHALEHEHRLDSRYEVLLSVAAQLHDVGMFIGSSSHHKHSKYIMDNSEIFGLGQENARLASLVARYHRGALPHSSHPDYESLLREDRIVVNKLAAILRAADALDRSHTQAIKQVKVVVKEEQVVVEVDRAGDFSAEKRALVGKGKMFEQVYGRTIILRTPKGRDN